MPEPAGGVPTAMDVDLYLLCRDEARIAQWERRRDDLPETRLSLKTGFSSMYAFINAAIADSKAPYLVLAHDDVVLGRNFAARVRDLAGELNERYPNWGVASNAGVGIDGRSYAIFVKDPWCEPMSAAAPKPVAAVDGNVMLVNRDNFIENGCEYPDLGGFHGYDIVLSYECLRKGLLPLADRRLTVIHLSGGNKGVYDTFKKSAVIQDYLTNRFSDASFPAMLGPITVDSARSDRRPSVALTTLFDAALLRANGGERRTLTLVRMQREAGTEDDAVVSGEAIVAALQPLVSVDVRTARLPRSTGRDAGAIDSEGLALIGDTLNSTTTDYVWFLPADATIDPGALLHVGRALAAGSERMVVLAHEIGTGADRQRVASNRIVQSMLWGAHFPLWAAVLPVGRLRELLPRARQMQLPEGLLPALVASAPSIDVERLDHVVVGRAREHSATANGAAFGSDEQWDQVTRLGALFAMPQLGSPLLRNTALNAASAPAPSRLMSASIGVGHVLDATASVLSQPRKHLFRGVSLAFGYLVRGDIKGLLREAELFRSR